MAKSARTSDLNAQLPAVTAKFWQHVEERCRLDGIPILQRSYYGVRPADRVQMTVTVGGVEQIVACEVAELWRRYINNLGMNADLFIASQAAVAAGLLKSSSRMGTDKKNPGKKRSYGVQFWTPTNSLYLSKKSQSPTSDTVTPADLVNALMGVEPVAELDAK